MDTANVDDCAHYSGKIASIITVPIPSKDNYLTLTYNLLLIS